MVPLLSLEQPGFHIKRNHRSKQQNKVKHFNGKKATRNQASVPKNYLTPKRRCSPQVYRRLEFYCVRLRPRVLRAVSSFTHSSTVCRCPFITRTGFLFTSVQRLFTWLRMSGRFVCFPALRQSASCRLRRKAGVGECYLELTKACMKTGSDQTHNRRSRVV